MDYIDLVASEKYKLSDLSQCSQRYIQGMQYAIECLELMSYESDSDRFDSCETLNRLYGEIHNNAIKECIENLNITMCKTIVSISENESED